MIVSPVERLIFDLKPSPGAGSRQVVWSARQLCFSIAGSRQEARDRVSLETILIGRIGRADLCFDGIRCDRLFMAASHSIYSLYVNAWDALGG
jgi:hypothetical protein